MQSTRVKEIQNDDQIEQGDNKPREFIIQIEEEPESDGSISDDIDSEEEDISISEEESVSLDVSSYALETNQESDCKDVMTNLRFKGSIKQLIKKQISHLFLFDNSVNINAEFKTTVEMT